MHHTLVHSYLEPSSDRQAAQRWQLRKQADAFAVGAKIFFSKRRHAQVAGPQLLRVLLKPPARGIVGYPFL